MLMFLSQMVSAQIRAELELNALKFVAGSEVELSYCIYQLPADREFSLLMDNGIARIQLRQQSVGSYLKFVLPEVITQKSGVVMARLFDGERIILQSQIEIIPDINQARKVESYCGPKHLLVDRNDFSMIVSTILDQYDNPLPKEEQLEIDYHADFEINKKSMFETSYSLITLLGDLPKER